MQNFRVAACQSLLRIFASIKTGAFSEENEWRLIIIKEPEYKGKELKFREGRTMLIPYLAVHLETTSDERLFSKVLAGPSQPQYLLQNAISQFNQNKEFTYSLTSSDISYRDW
ncbi:MAG: hypothetical protein RPR97_13405 [Colwellia sp.]